MERVIEEDAIRIDKKQYQVGKNEMSNLPIRKLFKESVVVKGICDLFNLNPITDITPFHKLMNRLSI